MQQEYNEVSCWQERLKVAESIMKLAEFQFVHIDPNPMLVLPIDWQGEGQEGLEDSKEGRGSQEGSIALLDIHFSFVHWMGSHQYLRDGPLRSGH